MQILAHRRQGVPATNLTAVSSAIGSGDAIRMTLSDDLSAVWYSVPAKLVNRLRGLEATVSVCGHAEAGFNENITATVWVDIINPTGLNSTASGGAVLANTTDLVMSNHTFTVPMGATTIKIGIITGGNAQGQDFNIESVDLLIGRADPFSLLNSLRIKQCNTSNQKNLLVNVRTDHDCYY